MSSWVIAKKCLINVVSLGEQFSCPQMSGDTWNALEHCLSLQGLSQSVQASHALGGMCQPCRDITDNPWPSQTEQPSYIWAIMRALPKLIQVHSVYTTLVRTVRLIHFRWEVLSHPRISRPPKKSWLLLPSLPEQGLKVDAQSYLWHQYPCSEEITHNFTIQVFKYVLVLLCCHKYRIYTLLTHLTSKIETLQQLQIRIQSLTGGILLFSNGFSPEMTMNLKCSRISRARSQQLKLCSAKLSGYWCEYGLQVGLRVPSKTGSLVQIFSSALRVYFICPFFNTNHLRMLWRYENWSCCILASKW